MDYFVFFHVDPQRTHLQPQSLGDLCRRLDGGLGVEGARADRDDL